MKRNVVKNKGFTLVEVLTTLVVTVIALGGLFMMEMATSKAQRGVRDIVVASRLAHFAMMSIREEALEWTTKATQGNTQTKFKWINKINDANNATPWLKMYSFPEDPQTVGPIGGDFSVQGSSISHPFDNGIAKAFPKNYIRRYCVWYSLNWIVKDYSMRVRIMVAWPKGISVANRLFARCDNEIIDSDLGQFITISSVINVYPSVQ